jgi:hypothetical protein
MFSASSFGVTTNVRVNLVALVDNCGSSNYTSSLVSAISRSLLKLDQARGGWAGTHNTLKKLTRINIEASARRRESAGSATLIIEQQSARGRHTNRHRVPIRLPPGNPLAPETAERSHPLGSPTRIPLVWFHDGYRPCNLAISRLVLSRVHVKRHRGEPGHM